MRYIASVDIYLPDGNINREVVGSDGCTAITFESDRALIIIWKDTICDKYYGMQCKATECAEPIVNR